MNKNSVLVLNCGSSSIKFSIMNTKNYNIYISGLIDSILSKDTKITWKNKKTTHIKLLPNYSCHTDAIKYIFTNIILKDNEILKNILAVGHRVVHGGEKIKKPKRINKLILNHIKKMSCFAPLHNPINALGIELSMEFIPKLKEKNVAVFDTSFHNTLPQNAYLYAIPYSLYKKHKIRKYGAHGISHEYALKKTALILKKPKNNINVITCHLGGGSSITAIKKGKSIDTSMGLTPLEGLAMGTRCGDIDPSIVYYMNKKLKLSVKEIFNILNSKSGVLGISQISSDFRYLTKNYNLKKHAKLSIDIFCYKLTKYISSFISCLNNKLDAIIFTGGIGENSSLIRYLTIKNLSFLGLKIDEKKNTTLKKNINFFINKKNTTPILVIPANEEKAIAIETMKIFQKNFSS